MTFYESLFEYGKQRQRRAQKAFNRPLNALVSIFVAILFAINVLCHLHAHENPNHGCASLTPPSPSSSLAVLLFCIPLVIEDFICRGAVLIAHINYA